MVGVFVAAGLAGFAIGIMSGMLGIGGGMVMVPLFRLVFGMSPVGATSTSLFAIIPTSASGAISHLRGKTCVPKLGVALGIGGACTSSLGVALAHISPGWLVMVATAAVIAYSASTMLVKAVRTPRNEAPNVVQGAAQNPPAQPGAPAQTAPPPTAPPLSGTDLLKAVLIGAAAGIASGYVGLGGGFIMVPLMASILNMPMKLTSGTSLIAVLILATPASVAQIALGSVDVVVGLATACGSIPGAIVGARLMRRIPERALRFIFAAFLLVAAALLVAKELGFLG